MKKIRVTLADDHPVVLAGIKSLLVSLNEIEVVGEATTGPMAMSLIFDLCPDVAIVDISLPGLNGIDLTKEIVSRAPMVKVLALTAHEDRAYVQPMLQAGARGYLLKRSAADELARALLAIADGGMYVDPAIAEKAFSVNSDAKVPVSGQLSDLANRELEVLKLVARGYSNKEIGIRLNVSVKTIETHKARAIAKLGLRTRADVVRFASIHEWLNQPSDE